MRNDRRASALRHPAVCAIPLVEINLGVGERVGEELGKHRRVEARLEIPLDNIGPHREVPLPIDGDIGPCRFLDIPGAQRAEVVVCKDMCLTKPTTL